MRHERVRTHRRFAAVAGAVTIALAVTACGGGGKTDKKSDASPAGATGAPGSSGDLTVLITQETRGIDPAVSTISSLNGGTQAAAVFDVLFWIDPKTGKAVPQLAEGATSDAEGKVWTIKLRPDVKFTDGTPLDAEAVKFNWERHQNPDNKSVAFAAAKGLTFEAVDATTLKVTLAAPNMAFDKLIAHNLAFIGSPTAIKADPKGFMAKPVGAGPFKVKSWVRDSALTLERNTAYWAKDKPLLSQVTFKPVMDQTQRLNALSAGQADLVTTANFKMVAEAKDKGLTVAYDEKNGGFMTMFKTDKPPFDDPRARRAYALIMDPADRAAKIQGPDGAGQTLKTFLMPSSPFVDPTAVMPSNNKVEAQALLDQLAAEGKPLKFTYTTNSSAAAHAGAEYWQAQTKGMKNIEMNLEFLDGSSYATKVMIQKDFQAAEFAVTFDDPEPVLYNVLDSKGAENRTGYSNPKVDEALDKARNSTDEAVRKAAYATVQQELVKDLPFFSYEKSFAAAVQGKKGKIEGLTLFEDGLILFDRVSVKS
ncbi:ABC transporter substrate-binding protein [Yinghuangia seranimata]|uniref:ABC transporter substrate-binding protein n=1 Tax=Yinghuangia seranimata TaxID=408067 RepID=UPI00248D1B1C|nr:ABC transporter substrate-binding protein [Yinghuangia seranimata]MDI2128574.1 ABC transporter substrate-binding protein [Yinghuangia seranimata]